MEERIEFEWLFVVESQANGGLGERINQLGHPRVRYYGEAENIGSAGNLSRRLHIAKELGADWLLAFNHDAPVEAGAVSALLEAARRVGDFGVLYPLRFEQARDLYDMSGLRWFPYRFRGAPVPPVDPLTRVYWGSSNGALYSLAPMGSGLVVQSNLWMGWEDYVYGLALDQAGWKQWLVRDASVKDSYEFRTRNLGAVSVALSDKPCWYYYYSSRNLLLAHLHVAPSIRGIAGLVAWLPVYTLRILAFPGRCSRWESLRILAHGVWDGIAGRRGKWRLP